MKFILFPTRALLLVPVFALIGAANNQQEWLGALVGGIVGLFFALTFLGRLPGWLARVVSPPDEQHSQ